MDKQQLIHHVLQLRKTLISYKDDDEMAESKEYNDYLNCIKTLKKEHEMTLEDIAEIIIK